MTIITIIAIALAVLFAAAAVIILYRGAREIEFLERSNKITEVVLDNKALQVERLPASQYRAVKRYDIYSVVSSDYISVWDIEITGDNEEYARRRAEEVAEMLNDKN